MNQENKNINEYKLEIIEKYNSVSKKSYRSGNVFAIGAIISAGLVVGTTILANKYNCSELLTLQEGSSNYLASVGLSTISYHLSSIDFSKEAEDYENEKFYDINKIEKYYRRNMKQNEKFAFQFNSGVIGLFATLPLYSTSVYSIAEQLLVLSPLIVCFKSIANRRKEISNEYQKVLNKIKK